MKGLERGVYDELKFLAEVAEPEDFDGVFDKYEEIKNSCKKFFYIF